MHRSIPIWIADSPDYTQGQEAWGEDGDFCARAAGEGRVGARDETGARALNGARVVRSAEGGEQPISNDGGEALRVLRDQIEEVGRGKDAPARVVIGAAADGAACAGIGVRFGAVHEWFQVEDEDARGGEARGGHDAARSGATRSRREARPRHWTPPLTLLAGVACEAMRMGAATRLVWIGRRVFPYPVFLARQQPSWLAASLFVDVRERDARVWAIDVALRSGVPMCVIADGQGITLAESRRLQVAAKCGRGMALLARPAHEAAVLSAAATRWLVSPCVVSASGVPQRASSQQASSQRASSQRASLPRTGLQRAGPMCEADVECERAEADGVSGAYTRVAWTLTLVRSKGEVLGMDAGSLIAEWRDAQGLVALPAMVASRTSRSPAVAAS